MGNVIAIDELRFKTMLAEAAAAGAKIALTGFVQQQSETTYYNKKQFALKAKICYNKLMSDISKGKLIITNKGIPAAELEKY